ncbi:MAG: nucleotidyltransferase [Bacteroidales bacterium]|nr:nucleotidyltransferase [Bacteroidales bacterium]
MSDFSLLVLAAGMGSRYGGLKQIDKLGPCGETIIDYSIYDAIEAGYNKVVFVIRKSIEQDFKECIADKYEGRIKVDYVLQELDNIPAGFSLPAERVKPWGTGHAILMAKDKIDGFFTVINGDDFYGRDAFGVSMAYLRQLSLQDKGSYAMVAYQLNKTLSENGAVSRGVCYVDSNHYLVNVKEHTKLQYENGKIINIGDDGNKVEMNPDTMVSMNFWCFHPSIFEHLQTMFTAFLEENIHNIKSEFYIPFVVDTLIKTGKACVKVLGSDAQWYGVTYREDREYVQAKLTEMSKAKLYPSPLWR